MVNMGRMTAWFCGVNVSRARACVCGVCYSTHHRVMSQARDSHYAGDFEGFLEALQEEEVVVHMETSLSA